MPGNCRTYLLWMITYHPASYHHRLYHYQFFLFLNSDHRHLYPHLFPLQARHSEGLFSLFTALFKSCSSFCFFSFAIFSSISTRVVSKETRGSPFFYGISLCHINLINDQVFITVYCLCCTGCNGSVKRGGRCIKIPAVIRSQE